MFNPGAAIRGAGNQQKPYFIIVNGSILKQLTLFTVTEAHESAIWLLFYPNKRFNTAIVTFYLCLNCSKDPVLAFLNALLEHSCDSLVFSMMSLLLNFASISECESAC
jgi:hypothetical protein